MDDKQGPAEGVTPVFTPMNPSFFNSLFVLTHFIDLVWLYVRLNILHENYFFATIYAKSGFFMAMYVRIEMSVAVEYAFSFIKPCAFINFVFFNFRADASRFICRINSLAWFFF